MRVFLSYAREDLAFGERLVAALRARQVDVLWDRTLSPSVDYSEQLREMIRACDTFAVLLTPHSVVSTECAAEMSYAIQLGKRLLPILGESEIDPSGLPDPMRKAQWCLSTGSDGLAGAALQIEQALQTNVELVAMHTRLLNRVEDWQARSHDAGTLLRGQLLEEAEAWLIRAAGMAQRPQPTDLQRAYLISSRAEETRRAAVRRRWAASGIAGLIGALVVMAYLYVDAERNRRTADINRKAADENAQKAKEQTKIANANAERANEQTRLANDNAHRANVQTGIANEQTLIARANADLATRRNRTLLEERGRQELLEGRWESAAVLLAEAFRLGSDTPALRLMLGGALLPLNGSRTAIIGGQSPITSAAISHDGRRVIAATLDGTATVWEIGTGRLISRLPSHPGPIGEVHLNSNGARALIVFTLTRVDQAEGGFYRTYEVPAYVWDVDRANLIRELDAGDAERLRNAVPPLAALDPAGDRFVLPNGNEFRFSDGEPVKR